MVAGEADGDVGLEAGQWRLEGQPADGVVRGADSIKDRVNPPAASPAAPPSSQTGKTLARISTVARAVAERNSAMPTSSLADLFSELKNCGPLM